MPSDIENCVIERSAVPLHFPQFKNAASLAHLAHCGKGPPYALVGGKAWYEVADIKNWLDANKRVGPVKTDMSIPRPPTTSTAIRGRPTKAEQFRRKQAAQSA